MTELHFLRPWWWIFLIPLAVAVMRLYRSQSTGLNWRGIVDEALAPYVLAGAEAKSRAWPAVWLGVCGLLAITSLAGPVWEKQAVPVFRADHKLVIALDLSQSMNATDIRPSRLARARHKIGDVISEFPETQTALLVFSEVPYIVSPVSDDADTLMSFLPALLTEIMPVQGGRISLALDKAGELLGSAGGSPGQVLLITDSSVNGEALTSAKTLKENGHRLSVLAAGTQEGGPVRLSDGSLLKDAQNNIVIPSLDLDGLRDLASIGGGSFSKLTSDNSDILALINSGSNLFDSEQSQAEEVFSDLWLEYGVWLILPLLLLFAGIFRRGILT